MRVFLSMLVSLCALAVPAMGQTVTNYADCSALDGTTIGGATPTGGTITDEIIVGSLADTDLIDIEIRVTGNFGHVNVQIDVDTDIIFSRSVAIDETFNASHDPDGDQSSTSILFSSEFVPDAQGLIEVTVNYTIACTPNSGTTTGTTPTTSVVTAFLAERTHRLRLERADPPLQRDRHA